MSKYYRRFVQTERLTRCVSEQFVRAVGSGYPLPFEMSVGSRNKQILPPDFLVLQTRGLETR
jgi:hypothetical protein